MNKKPNQITLKIKFKTSNKTNTTMFQDILKKKTHLNKNHL